MFAASKTAGASAGSSSANYIEDVFSTYLYAGTGSSLSINNGIDLSGKGGMVWAKNRTYGYDNSLFDTARGVNKWLISNSTAAQASSVNMLDAFNSNGFTLGTDAYTGGAVNASGSNYVSWTFRKQPKFFDVVTYTGNGGSQLVNHSLASTPGCIIAKRTDSTGNWEVWHRDLNFGTDGLLLNSTAAATAGNSDISSVNSTRFGVTQTTAFNINVTGATYVAYLFAHNAGGFGLTGTDNVISCGSYIDGNGVTVNLGYEPQWLLVKDASGTGSWVMMDSMRGLAMTDDRYLLANTSDAESSFGSAYWQPTATGFYIPTTATAPGRTLIYIAIRRGPMKVPTSGTSVFSPNATTGTSGTSITSGFPIDLQMSVMPRNTAQDKTFVVDRLRGQATATGGVRTEQAVLVTSNANAENSAGGYGAFTYAWNNTGFLIGGYGAGTSQIYWNFRRAPSFFDEVCYTGTGSTTTFNHNLGVAPELMIVKLRKTGPTAGGASWITYSSFLGATKYLLLNTDSAFGTYSGFWNDTAPTSSVFTVGGVPAVNAGTGEAYVAYLFATCAGVSKVGSYTGNGSTQTINCGFTGGARFVLIKRTDTTGDWYVWDTARGMVSGTDPSLLLNSTAAEVNANSIYTTTGGFQIVSTAAGINASGGTYIYLAIA